MCTRVTRERWEGGHVQPWESRHSGHRWTGANVGSTHGSRVGRRWAQHGAGCAAQIFARLRAPEKRELGGGFVAVTVVTWCVRRKSEIGLWPLAYHTLSGIEKKYDLIALSHSAC